MEEPEGKIVEYEPSMAEDVAVMFNKFKESFPGGFGGGVPFDEERIRDRYDESSSMADFIAVDDDGVPVGICTFVPHWRDPDAAYVGLLAVIERVKGKKYGKRLLLRSIERAIEEDIERVDLHTWSGNLNAMPLYKKIGMFWVPDTAVYMQDYIPLLHQNSFTGRWFDEHEDWYEYQERELKQEPDALTIEGMDVYRYRFEDEGDRMEVDIDRYGWGITGIHRKLGEDKFTLKAKVDSHDIHMGIENSYVLEFENHTDEKKEIDIQVKPFEGLGFKEDFPSSITVEKEEKKTISREFIVDNKAETHISQIYGSLPKASETIDTTLKVNGERVTLTTGGKIKPAVEVSSSRDLYRLFSKKEKVLYFDLKNNTEKVVSGEVSFKVDGKEKTKEFTLQSKEHGGISFPTNLDFKEEDIKHIELTPSIQKDTGQSSMETYKQPLVNDVDDLLGFAEKEDEIYLVNNEVKVKAELERGSVKVSERDRDSELPFDLTQKIGPPFGKTQDKTLRYDHDLVRDKKGLHLVLKGESRHKPGIVIKKHVRIKKHCSEVEFWSELKNMSDETIKVASETDTWKGGFQTDPYQSKGRIYTPLGDELIESDPVTDMLSRTLMPTDPEEWKETWTAYEDIADEAVSGLFWSNENITKVKSSRGMLGKLKSVAKELDPEESFKSTHLWVSVKRSSVNSLRRAWNRLVGKKEIHLNEWVHGKEPKEHIEARLDDNILQTNRESERKIIVDKAVDYPMPGEYTLRLPEYMGASFSNGKDRIKITEEEGEKELHLPVDIDVTEEPTSCVDNMVLHFSGEREIDLELPVIIVKKGEIKVEEKHIEEEKLQHVENGEITFDVIDDFGGNLIRLEDSEGNTYFDDNFPEIRPKSYFENHIGGIGPKFMTPDTFRSFYEIEDVSTEEFTDGMWSGVKVDLTIETLDALRGQKFSIKYLTLPGTKLIKIVLEHDNPKSREINWVCQFYIDVLLKDTLKDTIVETPGKDEDYIRSYQKQNFMTAPNIERPWFYFRDDDISIGGFAVEGSPGYSRVLCNDEINMGFLIANIVSQAFDKEEIELGIILDTSKDEIETARRALSSR